jgi:ribosome-associated toxin RatA of RatAB toxin-antitoxin module
MAEQTSGTTTIDATPADVMAVLTDFDAYPKWAGIKKVEVKKKDSKGRGTEVHMEVSQMGFEAKYTLSYTYKAKDGGMSWTTKEASGAVKDIKGEYDLEPAGDAKAKVTYHMAIEPAVKLPGFIKKQVEKQIVNTALSGLKKRVESVS